MYSQVVGFQMCGHYAQGALEFADRPQDAPVVHFGGPGRLGIVRPPTFHRGEPTSDLGVVIGTHGLGKGTLARLGFVRSLRHAQVTAEIEFPSKVPGGPPIKAKQVLQPD